jgi:hypothetical protein
MFLWVQNNAKVKAQTVYHKLYERDYLTSQTISLPIHPLFIHLIINYSNLIKRIIFQAFICYMYGTFISS